MSDHETSILTIAFEGIHRAGKGTQMSILEQRLKDSTVGVVQLRGDGSRSAFGDRIGDCESQWWKDQNGRFTTKSHRIEWWNSSADRLARELVIWRKRWMKHYLILNGYDQGLLILDRSIISRAAVLISGGMVHEWQTLAQNDLYSPKVNSKYVIPDIIFELFAPKSVIEERLRAGQENVFKRDMINREFKSYYQAKDRLGYSIRERVVTVNSDQDPYLVHGIVTKSITERFPWFAKDTLLR